MGNGNIRPGTQDRERGAVRAFTSGLRSMAGAQRPFDWPRSASMLASLAAWLSGLEARRWMVGGQL